MIMLVIMYFISKRIFVNDKARFTPVQDSVFEEILQKTAKTLRRLSKLESTERPLLYSFYYFLN